ncbi:MAG: T9SS type A sorting domain-containing protein [Bacteroidetes bacterium]|nr:T9SS type A sorting domain-containing protein [Bacteroidota bacterium]
MRKSLPFVSLFTGTLFISALASGQQSARIAWATTDVQQQNGNWVYLRQLNMDNGQFSDILLNGAADKQTPYDAATKKPIEVLDPKIADRGYNPLPAFNSGVAALALDKKNNRLWFTPMFIDQLRYIDLKTMKVYYVTDQTLTGITQKSSDQGNIVTRMVIASDGKGYAMTNDATHLLQFSTGKNISITDLGTIVDDPANKGISIHNSCSSFGGDIIADDDGNLFVFSARNHVFKINTETKVATHLGSISGLPGGFTVNGAAVTPDNKVIVASAMEATTYFYVDMKSLAATPYAIQGTVWHSSDLASSNLLKSGKGGATVTDVIGRNTPLANDHISIYPNPVTNNQFAVQFNQLEAGNYTIIVTDVMGRQIIQQQVSLSGDNQTQLIRLNAATSRGVYLVKVMDQSSKSIYSTKVILQ